MNFSYLKVKKFIRQNFFISFIVAITILTVLVSLFRYVSAPSQEIYVKIRLGQGLWWANTSKPPVWFPPAIQKGQKQKDLLGKTKAEIVEVRHYPSKASPDSLDLPAEYNIYTTIKLNIKRSPGTGKYVYNRTPVLVGSPIELEFPTVDITGTVIAVNETPIEDIYLEKEIVLFKKFSYPWEFDEIEIGDKYFDGEESVFEITGKRKTSTAIIDADAFGNLNPSIITGTNFIVLDVNIRVKQQNETFIFAEEQTLARGKSLVISTANFDYSNFTIASIR